ncbi:MAG: hypothetical protein KKC79_17415 [Gammaproteobacteria bacterium]|nr:hypothetical protein [Gammaproteobacteria bacterium]MBU1440120.1 hypothetical protein [Gammaproteobacteria bacterium]MBU2287359.1 hypothetical protein [Gammaproteobacteria bacterium]MBU2410416.1 hypothetical protein [Gammaproteobacteria bacterium]
MLKIHHLGHSQSERIVWLCEELALPYELQHHVRDAATQLSPPELKALHPLGAAPVIIRAYLKRIGERPAYRRAMAKGDPDLTPMLS